MFLSEKIKIGDIVKYRSWQLGDPEKESISKESRGWDKTGLVIKVGVDVFNSKHRPEIGVLEDAVHYIDSDGNITTARMADVQVLK